MPPSYHSQSRQNPAGRQTLRPHPQRRDLSGRPGHRRSRARRVHGTTLTRGAKTSHKPGSPSPSISRGRQNTPFLSFAISSRAPAAGAGLGCSFTLFNRRRLESGPPVPGLCLPDPGRNCPGPGFSLPDPGLCSKSRGFLSEPRDFASRHRVWGKSLWVLSFRPGTLSRRPVLPSLTRTPSCRPGTFSSELGIGLADRGLCPPDPGFAATGKSQAGADRRTGEGGAPSGLGSFDAEAGHGGTPNACSAGPRLPPHGWDRTCPAIRPLP